MKSRVRGTCVVWGVLLVLVFGLGSHCFAGDDLAKRWFFRLGDLVDAQLGNGSRPSVRVSDYYIMLLYLGEFERAYSVFEVENWEEEVGWFFDYALLHFYKEKTPREEHLELLFRELRDLKVDDRTWYYYYHLLDRAAAIDAHDLARKIIVQAMSQDIIGHLDDQEYDKASWLARVYKHCTKLGMNKEAANAEKKMIEQWSANSENSHLYGKDLLNARRIRCEICSQYIQAFLDLEKLDKAQIYIDRYKSTLLEDPANLVEYRLVDFIQLCQRFGQPLLARQLIEEMFDGMLPKKGDYPKDAKDFFSKWARYLPSSLFYEVADYDFLKRKWHLVMKRDNGKLAALVSRILFGGAVHHKDYSYAMEILETYEKKWKGGLDNLDWNYYYLIGNRIWHDPTFDYEKFEWAAGDPYYQLDLDYEYAWRMFKKNNRDKAKKFLNRAVDRLDALQDEESFRFNDVGYLSLLDLFWRMDDIDGILKIIQDYEHVYGENDQLTKFDKMLLFPRLMDVYLNNGEIDRALTFIKEKDDIDMQCVGYVYTSKKMLDLGETERGKKMMETVFNMLEEKKAEDLDSIVKAFYRIFFVRPGLVSPLDRPIWIDFGKDHNWGSRYRSGFETW